MSKTEIVTELQTILNDLKSITADLEQNISSLKDFLEDRKFIPKELGASIREQLKAIDAKQTEIVSKYEMLDVQKPEMQHKKQRKHFRIERTGLQQIRFS